MSGGGEKGEADAGGMAVAGERNHGDAHPDGFAGGGGAIVGEGIKSDVNAVVSGKVLGGGGKKAEEFSAISRNSGGGEAFVHRIANGRILEILTLEKKARAGAFLQQGCPSGECGVGDFEEIIEATERDRAGVIRHGGFGGVCGRFVGPGAGREADEFLSSESIGFAGRVGEGIDESMGNGWQSGCIRVAEIGHLDGS